MFKYQLCTTCAFLLLATQVEHHAIAQCDQGPAELQKLVTTDTAAFSDALTVNGDVMVVGSPFDTTLGIGAGAAYVFERQSGIWSEVTKLLASDGQSFDRFGDAAAASGDIIAIGATQAGGTGAVYIFDRSGGSWVETNRIQPGIPTAQYFGRYVDLDINSAGLLTLAVGSSLAGAYIFEQQTDGAWLQVFSSSLGSRVAISGDTVFTSDPLDDTAALNAGAVYVVERQGGVWAQTAQLIASDASAGLGFGESIDIDGELAVVGAPFMSSSLQLGAAYVFQRQGTLWVEDKIASDVADYGRRVAIQENMILAWDFGTPGTVDIHLLGGGSWNPWRALSAADPTPLISFGDSIAIDGEAIVVSGRTSFTNDGSLHVFSNSQTDSTGTLTQSHTTLSASLGGTVSFDIEAGASYAGQFYWVAGSFSGTEPGVLFGGQTIPLNQDPYFDLSLYSPNLYPFDNNVGVLDSSGRATAQVSVPAGASITGPGVLHHACVILDATLSPLFVSDAIELCVLP